MEQQQTARKQHAFITSRGTLDGAMPALVMALNSVRLGHDATIFYTFMGMEVIKHGGVEKLKYYPEGTMGAIPGMPHVATNMMKKWMSEANIPDPETMFEMAQIEGVRLVACHMTMEMMKLDQKDFVEGVEVWTAEDFIRFAGDCDICLFT
ncbi:DsrE/DsrF/DrsH-like family protein [uncultured Pseudodesulfovibrio sp.]|uniref:DsrE/DsrF/DrsH-like family protein n=1 Tax=uncultured Pseudodesulfovibrio sp. TaxID=2035858 RepID=UPI0029C95845|nr:DsrE/DsrF/DrsH-like family protein [uncultured Pseudodesulfovibrio sp.]